MFVQGGQRHIDAGGVRPHPQPQLEARTALVHRAHMREDVRFGASGVGTHSLHRPRQLLLDGGEIAGDDVHAAGTPHRLAGPHVTSRRDGGQRVAGAGTMQAFAGQMLPVRAGLAVPDQQQTIIAAPAVKRQRAAFERGIKHHAGIARIAEGHQPVLVIRAPLNDVVRQHDGHGKAVQHAVHLEGEQVRFRADDASIERGSQRLPTFHRQMCREEAGIEIVFQDSPPHIEENGFLHDRGYPVALF